MPGRQRLGLEHVESGARNVPGLQRRRQIGKINDYAATHVDQVRRPFHLPQPLTIHQLVCLGRVRGGDDDEVALPQQVIQPVRALILNALSLSATVGVLTWIFQQGHLAGLFQITARPMDTSMTVLMFCVTFGLSMDYEVFVISRIKELHDQGADPTVAVTRGLARTGRIVSAAAVLLAVSFFAFITGTVSFLQLFGLGSGLAILIDATLVRGVLVPVAMRVLGRAAWYSPRLLRRVHTRVALTEA